MANSSNFFAKGLPKRLEWGREEVQRSDLQRFKQLQWEEQHRWPSIGWGSWTRWTWPQLISITLCLFIDRQQISMKHFLLQSRIRVVDGCWLRLWHENPDLVYPYRSSLSILVGAAALELQRCLKGLSNLWRAFNLLVHLLFHGASTGFHRLPIGFP